ncbi:hypothetical protein QBC40DRAFT_281462, partial [Triangularia verruculosa]
MPRMHKAIHHTWSVIVFMPCFGTCWHAHWPFEPLCCPRRAFLLPQPRTGCGSLQMNDDGPPNHAGGKLETCFTREERRLPGTKAVS